MNRRTALRAIATAAAAWPMLVEGQASGRKKLPSIHVFEGPS